MKKIKTFYTKSNFAQKCCQLTLIYYSGRKVCFIGGDTDESTGRITKIQRKEYRLRESTNFCNFSRMLTIYSTGCFTKLFSFFSLSVIIYTNTRFHLYFHHPYTNSPLPDKTDFKVIYVLLYVCILGNDQRAFVPKRNSCLAYVCIHSNHQLPLF